MPEALFSNLTTNLSSLMEQIASGQLGLPDIQRPFVWKNVAVRDLFDSMYRGFPVGNFLLWHTGVDTKAHRIGHEPKQLAPSLVIVDGQQRLTSLYAVVKGVPVVREDYRSERIEIAFNPLVERFAVTDAAIRKDPEFLPDISEVWGRPLIPTIRAFLKRLTAARGELAEADETRIEEAIGRLAGLTSYTFTALQLSASARVEEVSEVFVRINSKGKQLNQADFILTLMSVFQDEGRKTLEAFSREARIPASGTAYNHHIAPSPDQLLRVAVALAFRRARLSAVYALLRGRGLDDVGESEAERQAHFAVLSKGQAVTLKRQNWCDFLTCLTFAGYRSSRMISSQNAILFTYVLFLIGRTDFNVELHRLRRAVARWFFMSSLTGRYTTSPESQMETDLARLRGVTDGDSFLAELDRLSAATLTSDFWSITLPNDLATSAARSPSMFAYLAALNVSKARALYSDHTVSELMDPALQGTRNSLERHHLFPKAYLKSIGVTEERDYNQIANFTVLEWGDNTAISDNAPATYGPILAARFEGTELARVYEDHGLPPGWEQMTYPAFLEDRRRRMAKVISRAYAKLSGEPSGAVGTSVPVDLGQGESERLEFKSSLRTNVKTRERDARMELSALKSVAGFLNGQGGAVGIGIDDAGAPTGLLEIDGFADEDKASLHAANLLRDRLGAQHALSLRTGFIDHAGGRVLLIESAKGAIPAFVKDGAVERFYVRQGPATTELTGSQMQSYIAQRFG